MAKKRGKQEQFEGALDSIYNLIFNSPRKPDKPLKPPKRTYLPSSQQHFVNALSDIANNPALYVSESFLKTAEAVTGKTIYDEFVFGRAPTYEVDFKTTDLPKFFADPNKFIEGKVQSVMAARKADRQLTRFRNLGKAMDGVGAFLLARKAGVSIGKSYRLARAADEVVGAGAEKEMEKALMETAAMNFVVAKKDGFSSKDEKELAQKIREGKIDINERDLEEAKRLGKATFEAIERIRPKAGLIVRTGLDTPAGMPPLTAWWSKVDKDPKTLEGVSLSPEINKQADDFMKKNYPKVKPPFYDNFLKTSKDPKKIKEREKYDLELRKYNEIRSNKLQELSQAENSRLKDIVLSELRRDPELAPFAEQLFPQIQDAITKSHQGYLDSGAAPTASSYRKALRNNILSQMRFVKSDRKLMDELKNEYWLLNRLQTVYGVDDFRMHDAVYELRQKRNELVANGVRTGRLSSLDRELNKILALQKDTQRYGRLTMMDLNYTEKQRKGMIAYQKALSEYYGFLANNAKTPEERKRLLEEKQSADYYSKFYSQNNRLGQAFDQFQLTMESLKSKMDGGLAQTVVSGDYWMKGNSDTLSPSGGFKVAVYYKKKEYNKKTGKYEYKTDVKVDKIAIPKDQGGWKEAATNLFYLTPASVYRTFLWNGEAWTYNAWKEQRRMTQRVIDMANRDSEFREYLGQLYGVSPDLITADVIANGGLNDKNPDPLFFDLANRDFEESSKYYRFFKELKKRKGKIEFWRKLARPFWGKNLSDGWDGFVDPILGKSGLYTLYKQNMDYMAFSLLQRLPILNKQPLWKSTIAKYMKGDVGLDTLVASGVHSLLNAFGMTSGPLGTLVTTIVNWFMPEIQEAILAPVMKMSLAIFYILVAGFLSIFLIGGSLMFQTHAPQATVTPVNADITLKYPEGSAGGSPSGVTPNLPLGDLPDLPDDMKCPFEGDMICIQGAGAIGFTHEKSGAVDIVDWKGYHAPEDGVIVSINPHVAPCDDHMDIGGDLYFYGVESDTTYRLLHVDAAEGIYEGVTFSKGDLIATMTTNLVDSMCWSGEHFHLQTYEGEGKTVQYNTVDFYKELCPWFNTDTCCMEYQDIDNDGWLECVTRLGDL